MELELCGSSDESSSSGDKELEEELYSVLHYSDFSNGIPEELREKYDIVLSDSGCSIQLKPREIDSVKSDDDGVEIESLSSSSDSSVNEIVILEKDPFARPKPQAVHLSSGMSDVESLSDSDSSDLIVLEPKRKSPILLSDDEDIHINLDVNEDDGCMSDGQVSDVVGTLSYDWKNVSSPTTWSDAMRKYYNRPCSTLRYFDFRKIKNELLNAKGVEWPINNGDRFSINIPRRRCLICRQPGHFAQTCPKRYPNCLMCGNEGHTSKHCPASKCLNCGRHASSYVTMCGKCRRTTETTTCYTCKQRGHWAKECPNNWRRFHSITGGNTKIKNSDASINPNVNCSNCGEQGHFYEKCRQGFHSPYPPVSTLVVQENNRRASDPEPTSSRKRKQSNGPSPNTPERKRAKRGNKDFLRHLSSVTQEGGKNSSKKRKQKRYFNLTV